MKKLDKKKDVRAEGIDKFLQGLAEYLVGGQALKSVELQMGKVSAKEWATLRNLTPLAGYPTVLEAKEILRMWLFEDEGRKDKLAKLKAAVCEYLDAKGGIEKTSATQRLFWLIGRKASGWGC